MKRSLAGLLALALTASLAQAAPEVRGFFTTDGLTGGEAQPHGWYEQYVYLAPADGGAAIGARTIGNPPGWFGLRMPGGGSIAGGQYALFNLKFDDYVAFGVTRGVDLPETDEIIDHQKHHTGAHYAVMYNQGHLEWDEHPWVKGADMYQTFVATGPTVTRVATRLADKTPEYTAIYLNYAIYEPTDGPPSEWKLISPVRTQYLSPTTDPIIHIFWVPYRSNEVTLTPGQTYAVRLWRDERSQSEEFALVARPDKDGGYPKGMLYLDGKAMPDWDAFLYVSGGEPGTVVNHAPVEDMKAGDQLLGWNETFGQTFKASGTSVAAVDIVFARIHGTAYDIPVTFQVYDAPGGTPIGPARSCYGVPGAFQARAAVLWERGEVPTEPGKTYYIEGKSEGLNLWPMNEDIPGVQAYIEGEARDGTDMMMSVAEYVGE